MATVSLSLDEIYDLAKKTLLFNGCDELCRLIERAGCAAVKRDTIYSNFERLESTKSSSQTLVMVK